VDEFVVQTPTMKSLLENKINGRVPVRILPFVADPSGYYHKLLHPIAENDWSYDFVYVASGESHKNHDTLIEAWCLLAREGLLPSLCLTLDKIRFPALCDQIEEIKKISAVNIINLGVLDPSEVLQLYARSHAAIYPSKLESFGLPLIEARQAGLPILASELDYVRDVVDPEQTFDPDSPMSIARAVKRFLGVEVTPIPLLSASQFLESVFNKPAVTNP
jgi:glycosyltransferase involved in cell wall biosynthesis